MSGNNEQADTIFIRSRSANNGITTMFIGAFLLAAGSICIVFLPSLFFLVGILFISASIVAFVMGCFKLQEPPYSLEINKQRIVYYHRKGTWEITWENIQRIDCPRISKGLEMLELEMLGFRLRDPEIFLKSISPRLVTHLLMEQRPLLTQALSSNCQSGQCYGDEIIDDVEYKCKNDSILTGVMAMFANRMRKLQAGLGYDVYVSTNDLDRDAHEFVNLLRECQESVLISQDDKQSNTDSQN